MKRAFKIISWAVGIFLFLLALAALAVKLFLPKEKVKAIILQRASAALHREVRLDDLSVSLISGLMLSHFEISEVPDFAHGVFLTSDRFALRPQLLPLLSKKVYIDVVAINKPAITIVREKDGKTFNFSDLMTSPPSAAKTSASAPTSAPSPFAFLVSKISVENGRIMFVDHSAAAMSTTLENLNVTVRNATMVGPMDVALSVEAATKGVKARLDVKSSVSLLQGSANIESLTITSGGAQLEAKGDIKNMTADPKIELKWDLREFDPQILGPMNLLPAEVKIAGKINGHGTVGGGTQSGTLTVAVDAANTDIRYGTATFHKQTGVAMSIAMTAHYRMPLLMEMSDLKLQLAQLQLSGPASYSNAGYKADLGSNEFPLESLTPMVSALSDVSVKGPAELVVKVKSAGAGPEVQGTATLKNVSAATKGVTLSSIQSKINFTAGDTNGTLTATTVQHDYFSGNNLNLQWNLVRITDLAKMGGTANLNLGPGEIKNIQKLTADNKIAKILFFPISILQKAAGVAKGAVKLPSFDQVPYKTIVGKYQFQNGTMTISSFDLAATAFSAGMKGTIGLVGTQPINANSQVTLPEGAIGGVGPLTVKMAIAGTVADPQVNVDKADAGKQILNAVSQKLGKDPAAKVENLFKGLFKK